MSKLQRKPVNGILLLDKAKNISSNRGLQRVRSLFNAKKAGHTGTLDPFATGLLVVCFGEANKYSRWLIDANKKYEFVAELGQHSTTGDPEGIITQHKVIPQITEQNLFNVTEKFTGVIKQIPSKYSAIKINGQRAYNLARQGKQFDVPEREVTIHSLSLEIKNNQLHGCATVSKGTYIRNLVEDIAISLGTIAYCSSLRRTMINELMVEKSYLHTDLELLDEDNLKNTLYPIDMLCQQFEKIHINKSDYVTLSYGQQCDNSYNLSLNNHLIRLYYENFFVGLGEIKGDKIKSFRLTNTMKNL